MEPRTLVWLIVCGGLVLALSAMGISGWFLGAVGVLAVVLAALATVTRFRIEWRLARTLWRTLTAR